MTEEKTVDEALIEKKAAELKEGSEEGSNESPLEEARRLNIETKKTLESIQDERDTLAVQKATAELHGKASAGQKTKTQEDIDQETAEEIINRFE